MVPVITESHFRCAVPFVNTLREAGYSTRQIGKIHLQNMTDIPPSWPVNPADRLSSEARTPETGRYDQEKRRLWLSRDDYALDLPYYGFEHVDGR